MNLIGIAKVFTRNAAHILRKHAPEILVVSGSVGAVAAAVLACKETLNVNDILEEGEAELAQIDEYSTGNKKEDTKKKLISKAHTAGKLALNYAPAALTMGASIAMILGGHGLLKKRHAATAAALLDVSTKYDKYRERIKEKYGEEIEKKILTDEHNEKVDETVTDPETGKEKTRKVTKTVLGDDLTMGYKITLDRQNCYNFSNDFDSWMKTMKILEQELDNNLQADAILCGKSVMRLETILRSIGMKDIRPEALRKFKDAGVYYSKKHPCHIDLGLEEAQKLKDWGQVDESEMQLCINVVPDIWAYSDAIEKGEI